MSNAHTGEVGFAGRVGSGAAAPGAAGWLALAAAPTFAVMALISAVHGDGSFDAFCSVAHGGMSLTGMAPMYALMSAFHSAPWLKLISSWRRGSSP
jgi:hypothetical protein